MKTQSSNTPESRQVLGYPSLRAVIDAALQSPFLHPAPHPEGATQDLLLEWSSPGTRSRKVVKRSNLRMTGKFPSRKNGRMIHWESLNELNAFKILETHPSVSSFREQPLVISYLDGSETRRHFPDIHVVLVNGTQLILEIKDDQGAIKDDVVVRSKILSEALALQHQLRYLVIASSQLSGRHLKNAEYILRWSSPINDPVFTEMVRSLFHRQKTIILADLISHFEGMDGHPKRKIFAMLGNGYLHFDPDTTLCDESELGWKGGY